MLLDELDRFFQRKKRADAAIFDSFVYFTFKNTLVLYIIFKNCRSRAIKITKCRFEIRIPTMNKKIKEKIRITIDDVPHRSGMGSLEADVSGAAVDTLRLDQATGFSGNGPSQNDCHPLDHTSNLADDYKVFPGLAETKPASPRMTLASSRKTSNRLDAISVERRDTMALMRQWHCRHGCERARCSRSGAQWLTLSNDETARASLNANNDRAGTVRPRLISHCQPRGETKPDFALRKRSDRSA